MGDKTHMDSVERWANYVKNNPDWKKIYTEFIDAKFEKAYAAIERILKTPNGKIKKIYNTKNEKAYPKIFG